MNTQHTDALMMVTLQKKKQQKNKTTCVKSEFNICSVTSLLAYCDVHTKKTEGRRLGFILWFLVGWMTI